MLTSFGPKNCVYPNYSDLTRPTDFPPKASGGFSNGKSPKFFFSGKSRFLKYDSEFGQICVAHNPSFHHKKKTTAQKLTPPTRSSKLRSYVNSTNDLKIALHLGWFGANGLRGRWRCRVLRGIYGVSTSDPRGVGEGWCENKSWF